MLLAARPDKPLTTLLTDWGPTDAGWFRSGAAHKRATLERHRHDHPGTRWILVGDDGQRDPQIYAMFAEAHPGAVDAVAIRRLTRTQRALANGAGEDPGNLAGPVRSSAIGSRWVTGTDGYELAAALEPVLGLSDSAGASAVGQNRRDRC